MCSFRKAKKFNLASKQVRYALEFQPYAEQLEIPRGSLGVYLARHSQSF